MSIKPLNVFIKTPSSQKKVQNSHQKCSNFLKFNSIKRVTTMVKNVRSFQNVNCQEKVTNINNFLICQENVRSFR